MLQIHAPLHATKHEKEDDGSVQTSWTGNRPKWMTAMRHANDGTAGAHDLTKRLAKGGGVRNQFAIAATTRLRM